MNEPVPMVAPDPRVDLALEVNALTQVEDARLADARSRELACIPTFGLWLVCASCETCHVPAQTGLTDCVALPHLPAHMGSSPMRDMGERRERRLVGTWMEALVVQGWVCCVVRTS